MAYNGTQAEWQTALGSGWSVLQTGDGQFTLERTTAGVYTLVEADVDVTGLSVYEGLIGTLGFNAGTLFKRFLTEGDSSFVTTLEVKYDDGTYRSTILQVPVTLTKEILSSAALAPSNWNGGFYTKTESDNRFPIWLPAITGFTGGGSSNIDGLTTAAGEWTDRILLMANSGALKAYRLVAGTDAESSPTVIRPDDYNASTNAFVWKLVL